MHGAGERTASGAAAGFHGCFFPGEHQRIPPAPQNPPALRQVHGSPGRTHPRPGSAAGSSQPAGTHDCYGKNQ